MGLPIQITFRDVEPSEAVESRVRVLANKLERHCDKIMGCRVMIETPHRHQTKGNLYHVRIDLSVPDAELVSSREQHLGHEDIYVSIRDAFKAIRRQLQDYTDQRRGMVKHHQTRFKDQDKKDHNRDEDE